MVIINTNVIVIVNLTHSHPLPFGLQMIFMRPSKEILTNISVLVLASPRILSSCSQIFILLTLSSLHHSVLQPSSVITSKSHWKEQFDGPCVNRR